MTAVKKQKVFADIWRDLSMGLESIYTDQDKMPPQQYMGLYRLVVKNGANLVDVHNNHPINHNNSNSTKNTQFSNTFKFATDTKRTGHIVSDDDFLGQFECVYLNCGKRLKNNIALMWHVWAHCVQQNPTEIEEVTNLHFLEAVGRNGNGKVNDDGRTDVTRLTTCPECLLVQPNPHRIHLHYHRVHKWDRPATLLPPTLHICNICEQVISGKDMNVHIQSHQLNGERRIDLPYPCRYRYGGKGCGFRVSNRSALIEHFSAKHQGTYVLLCPFCLYTFSIPSNDRRSKRIKATDYCQHVLMHVIEKTLFCSLCVARFSHSNESQYQQHLLQHTSKLEQKWAQWNQTTREIQNIKRLKTQSVSTDIVFQQCLECGQELRSFLEHFGDSPRKCEECEFTTFCSEAFYKHQILEKCKSENSLRWPFGVKNYPICCPPKLSNNHQSLQIFGCSKCHFRTTSVQKIAEHIEMVQCLDGKIIIHSMDPNFNEQEEARLFGLLEMEDIKKDKEDEDVGSTMALSCSKIQGTSSTTVSANNAIGVNVERCMEETVIRKRLGEFTPLTKIPEIIENKLALKYLFSHDNNYNEDRSLDRKNTDRNCQDPNILIKRLRSAMHK